MAPLHPRYEACATLTQAQIPCTIWFEDAGRHYGVPTCLFDLYLLVPDIDKASEVLAQAGWNPLIFDEDETGWIGHHPVESPQRRLLPPSSQDHGSRPEVALLPASEWHYTAQNVSLKDYASLEVLPPLPALVDSLIIAILDGPQDLWVPSRLHLAYLFDYVHGLKDVAFVDKLQEDNRQFLLDLIAGADLCLSFVLHQRKVRDELRAGTRTLQDCSAPGHPDLFRAPFRPSTSKPWPHPPPSFIEPITEPVVVLSVRERLKRCRELDRVLKAGTPSSDAPEAGTAGS